MNKNIIEKPEILKTVDIKPLQEICQEYINDIDDDIEHYIFETAMEVIFGKNVWDYINSRL